MSQTRTGATPNADGAANADGERAQALTLSAFGYLIQVAAPFARRLTGYSLAVSGPKG